jgi:hypothetical protein
VAEGENEDDMSDGNEEEGVMDVVDGIDRGEEGSTIGGDTDVDEEDGTEDDEESTNDEGVEEDPIVGNSFVEEVAEELAGLRTKQGRRYDRGGTCDSEHYSLHL